MKLIVKVVIQLNSELYKIMTVFVLMDIFKIQMLIYIFVANVILDVKHAF